MAEIDEVKKSVEEREQQFSQVLETIIEKRKDSPPGTYGEIDLPLLDKLTEPLVDEKEVIKHNQQLTETYKHIIAAYGFEDYYSLYLFAKSVSQEKELETIAKSNTPRDGEGKKDFSKLAKIKRTVIRNGKPTRMTFYEDIRGTDNRLKSKGGKGNKATQPVESHARELNIIAAGELGNPITTEELQAARKLTEGMIEVLPDFDSLDRVKVYVDENLATQAIQGLRKEGEYLTTSYLAHTPATLDIYPRAFFETIKVAMNWELGVILAKDEIELQQALAQSVNLKDTKDTYQATYKELVNTFGGTLP